MTNISGVLSSGVYGYNAQPASTAPAAVTPVTTAASIAATTSVSSTFSSSGATPPLTYNAAGQVSSATHVTPQAAQADLLAAKSAMNQALASMLSGTSSNSSNNTDIFGASSASSTGSSPANTASTTSAITAQNAYLATQNAMTQALGTITG